MAKGAGETGKVESYMCSKVSRNPIVASSCAEYLGYFQASKCSSRGAQLAGRLGGAC